MVALEKLEDQTDRSDAYKESVIGSGALGYASKGEVFGETSIDSVVDDVSSAELNAQLELVKAAKIEVRQPTPDTFEPCSPPVRRWPQPGIKGREADEAGVSI